MTIAPQKIADLSEVLKVLEMHDVGEVELSKAECTLTVDMLRDRVDDIRFALKKAEAVEKAYAELIKELQAKKSSVKKNAEWFETEIIKLMQSNASEQLPGHMFRMQLNNTAGSTVIDYEADAGHAFEYPALVKTTYAWDLKAAKLAIEAGKFPIGKIEPGKSLAFYSVNVDKKGKS